MYRVALEEQIGERVLYEVDGIEIAIPSGSEDWVSEIVIEFNSQQRPLPYEVIPVIR